MENQANVISGIDYSRQEMFTRQMEGIDGRHNHIIVGCGGIGWWLAILLALHGVPKLTLIDGDKVDSSNLNRLPVPITWRGVNKAIALRKSLKAIRPEMIVTVIPAHMESNFAKQTIEKLSSGQYVQIWDCTDHLPTQKALFALSKEDEVHVGYRKIGYEGMEIGTYVDYSVWATTDTAEQHGYRTSAANAVSSVMAACLGMLAHGMSIDRDVNLNLRSMIEDGAKTTVRSLTTRKPVVVPHMDDEAHDDHHQNDDEEEL